MWKGNERARDDYGKLQGGIPTHGGTRGSQDAEYRNIQYPAQRSGGGSNSLHPPRASYQTDYSMDSPEKDPFGTFAGTLGKTHQNLAQRLQQFNMSGGSFEDMANYHQAIEQLGYVDKKAKSELLQLQKAKSRTRRGSDERATSKGNVDPEATDGGSFVGPGGSNAAGLQKNSGHPGTSSKSRANGSIRSSFDVNNYSTWGSAAAGLVGSEWAKDDLTPAEGLSLNSRKDLDLATKDRGKSKGSFGTSADSRGFGLEDGRATMGSEAFNNEYGLDEDPFGFSPVASKAASPRQAKAGGGIDEKHMWEQTTGGTPEIQAPDFEISNGHSGYMQASSGFGLPSSSAASVEVPSARRPVLANPPEDLSTADFALSNGGRGSRVSQDMAGSRRMKRPITQQSSGFGLPDSTAESVDFSSSKRREQDRPAAQPRNPRRTNMLAAPTDQLSTEDFALSNGRSVAHDSPSASQFKVKASMASSTAGKSGVSGRRRVPLERVRRSQSAFEVSQTTAASDILRTSQSTPGSSHANLREVGARVSATAMQPHELGTNDFNHEVAGHPRWEMTGDSHEGHAEWRVSSSGEMAREGDGDVGVKAQHTGHDQDLGGRRSQSDVHAPAGKRNGSGFPAPNRKIARPTSGSQRRREMKREAGRRAGLGAPRRRFPIPASPKSLQGAEDAEMAYNADEFIDYDADSKENHTPVAGSKQFSRPGSKAFPRRVSRIDTTELAESVRPSTEQRAAVGPGARAWGSPRYYETGYPKHGRRRPLGTEQGPVCIPLRLHLDTFKQNASPPFGTRELPKPALGGARPLGFGPDGFRLASPASHMISAGLPTGQTLESPHGSLMSPESSDTSGGTFGKGRYNYRRVSGNQRPILRPPLVDGKPKPVEGDGTSSGILKACSHCGRKFNLQSLAKHEPVCQKVFAGRRQNHARKSRSAKPNERIPVELPPLHRSPRDNRSAGGSQCSSPPGSGRRNSTGSAQGRRTPTSGRHSDRGATPTSGRSTTGAAAERELQSRPNSAGSSVAGSPRPANLPKMTGSVSTGQPRTRPTAHRGSRRRFGRSTVVKKEQNEGYVCSMCGAPQRTQDWCMQCGSNFKHSPPILPRGHNRTRSVGSSSKAKSLSRDSRLSSRRRRESPREKGKELSKATRTRISRKKGASGISRKTFST